MTFKRAKVDKGYLHVYFLNFSIGVTLTDDLKDEGEFEEAFDIRIPFMKQNENEFIEFGKKFLYKYLHKNNG